MVTGVVENHLDEHLPKWFAVQTRFKAEKMVQQHLIAKGVEVYLPLQQVIRRYERKIRKLELPLIPCYIFVRITKSQYLAVLQTANVTGFVRFSNNLIAVKDEEMDLLHRIVGEGIETSALPGHFSEGDTVEITQGRLAGIHARLVSVQGKHNVVIELQSIPFSLLLEVDPKLIRKKQFMMS